MLCGGVLLELLCNTSLKMSGQAVKRVVQEVKPILSLDREEARKRVLNLYKAWYRQLPYIGLKFQRNI